MLQKLYVDMQLVALIGLAFLILVLSTQRPIRMFAIWLSRVVYIFARGMITLLVSIALITGLASDLEVVLTKNFPQIKSEQYWGWIRTPVLGLRSTVCPYGDKLIINSFLCRSDDRIEITVGNSDKGQATTLSLQPGNGLREQFMDCELCPVMLVVPASSFTLGAGPATDKDAGQNEGPPQEVAIPNPFGISRHEIAVEQWRACVTAGVCTFKDWGDRPADLPATGISWFDANTFARWLSEKTGKKYRLPTEAEWEYAARAGSKSRFIWDEPLVLPLFVNFTPSSGSVAERCADVSQRKRFGVVAVDQCPMSFWGLRNVLGNAAEWVLDCYRDQPVHITNPEVERGSSCSERVVRGGSYADTAKSVRVTSRMAVAPNPPSVKERIGFRVMREL